MGRFVVAVAVVALAAFAAPSAFAYGALAIGKSRDGTPAVALITRPNAERARADAMMVCERIASRRGAPQQPCSLVRTFENRCYAVAVDNRNRTFIGSSINENYWARVRAQDECRRNGGGPSCRVVRSICDRTVGRPVNPPAGQARGAGGPPN
jgi:hypothetical protein